MDLLENVDLVVLGLLADDYDDNDEVLRQLVGLLENGSEGQKELTVEALRRTLTDGDASYKDSIVKAGAIPPLALLLANGSFVAKLDAAGVLVLLAEGNEKHKVSIAKAGVIPHLVALLTRNGIDGIAIDVSEIAKRTLRFLSYS